MRTINGVNTYAQKSSTVSNWATLRRFSIQSRPFSFLQYHNCHLFCSGCFLVADSDPSLVLVVVTLESSVAPSFFTGTSVLESPCPWSRRHGIRRRRRRRHGIRRRRQQKKKKTQYEKKTAWKNTGLSTCSLGGILPQLSRHQQPWSLDTIEYTIEQKGVNHSILKVKNDLKTDSFGLVRDGTEKDPNGMKRS